MTDKAAVFREAQRFLSKGQIDKAIYAWQEYVTRHPDGNIYNTIGDLCLKNGNRALAVDYFHKAAEYFRDEGFITKALALYKKILNIDSSDPKALLFIGRLNEEKGLITDAIKYYLASIDAYIKHGDRDELIPICERIINLAPTNLSLRVKLAEYLQKEGYVEEAAREYLEIGKISEKKGDFDKARECYERSFELYPRQEAVYKLLAGFYIARGLTEEAKDLLAKGTELHPDNIDLQLLYAELLLKEGDLSAAKDILQRILSAYPAGSGDEVAVEASRLLGEIYLEEGQGELAWDSYKTVVDYYLGRGLYEEAVEFLKKFRETSPLECSEKLVQLYQRLGREEELFEELLTLAEIQLSQGSLEDAFTTYIEAKKIRPDSETVISRIAELEEKLGIAFPTETEEKATDEKLVDVDIFLRYGLLDEAVDILEKLKVEEPGNLEVHKRLKDIYLEMNDKEGAVTECLILARIHEKEGRVEQREQALKEAFEIDPEDPRLLELTSATEEVSASPSPDTEFTGSGNIGFEEEGPESPPPSVVEQEDIQETSVTPAGASSLDDFKDELSEAEFYQRQGLYEEAVSIYNRVLEVFPDNEDIRAKVEEIRSRISTKETPAPASPEPPPASIDSMPAQDVDSGVSEGMVPPDMVSETGPVGDVMTEEPVEEGVPEPTLDSEVLEIFEEFKRGVSEELEEEDSETHYNLGIAYKEMGLVDDAIKEFQTARKDPNRRVQAASMLGLCFMEKKLYPLAIDALQEAIDNIEEKDEAYWSTKYELAEAYEKNGDAERALDLYVEVFGWDSKFRDVGEKVNALKEKLGVGKQTDAAVVGDAFKPRKDRISYL
ncbi:MAG: tetratricopeptide repeat protein [Nitrospirae bacterium]|nr:tetratricopeptide repeat protein [Nitrospirota bacterium]